MRIPISCSLDGPGQGDREAEWRKFHQDEVVETERESNVRVRLRLDPARPDAVAVAIDLARREKACCSFFDFSLQILVDETWLEIVVPLDAADILDEFAVAIR